MATQNQCVCAQYQMLVYKLRGGLNKTPHRKQRGIKSVLQAAGLQPAFAPRSEELNPVEIKSLHSIGS